MKKEISLLTLKIFSGIFITITILISFMYNQSFNSELNKIKSREISDLNKHNSVLVRIINSLTTDALFLSKLPDTKEFKNSDHLPKTFLEFSSSKKKYDQVRFLDLNGQEKVRINWNSGNPNIVSNNKLQNKKGRYYFDDTIKLRKNELFISPLDLNIENGEIEKPIKPMLRIGTPVFDFNNNKIGIILLNYFASDLIEELTSNVNNHNFFFLNQKGYFLSSQEKKDEWGFMFPEKLNITFEKKFSHKIWKIINNNYYGQFKNKQGIFTYNTIYPLNAMHSSSSGSTQAYESSKADIDWKHYKWKLVSFISNQKILDLTKNIRRNYLLVWIFFVIINVTFSYFLAKSIIKQRNSEKNRIAAEKKYRILFEEAGESIVVTQINKTLMINKRTVDLFAYSETEILSIPIEALIHIDDRELVIENQKKQLQNGIESLIFESRILTKNGKIKWAEIRSTKLDFDNESSILYFFLDISERKKMEEKLKKLATTDSLTECYNRRFFNEQLEKEIERAQRLKHKLSVIMIDLDHFKNINDTYGHDVGDLVLKKFADITKIEVRKIDTIGRIGGEEFAIILPNCSETNGVNCAERIRNSIQESKIDYSNNDIIDKIHFTASFGITEVKTSDTIEQILKRIDNALYKAKKNGRNQTVLI